MFLSPYRSHSLHGTGHHKYIHSQCFYKLIRFLSFPKWMKSANTQEAEHVQSNADGFMFAESGLRKLNQSDWVIGKLVENNLCSISSVYHSYKCDYCPWGMLEFELIYLVFVYLCICVFVYLCGRVVECGLYLARPIFMIHILFFLPHTLDSTWYGHLDMTMTWYGHGMIWYYNIWYGYGNGLIWIWKWYERDMEM